MNIGASGILLQSNGPLRWAYAKSFGVTLDWRNRLIGGKYCAVPASKLRKCALKFHMNTSAAFSRCVPGGTRSSYILYSSCIIVFKASDISLSSMCFFGIIPALRRLRIMYLYAHVSSSSLWFLMGLTSIALLSIFPNTMVYLLPCCECIGNCPVWLDKTVFLTLYKLVYTSCALCPCSVAILGTLRGVRLGLVDLKFFLIGSDVLLESRWSLGSIWRRCVQLALAILLSYLLWWPLSTWTWLHIRILRALIWQPLLWMAGRICYVPAVVLFSLPLWVCMIAIACDIGIMVFGIYHVHIPCRWEWALSDM